jgi:hypothetical protein
MKTKPIAAKKYSSFANVVWAQVTPYASSYRMCTHLLKAANHAQLFITGLGHNVPIGNVYCAV